MKVPENWICKLRVRKINGNISSSQGLNFSFMSTMKMGNQLSLSGLIPSRIPGKTLPSAWRVSRIPTICSCSSSLDRARLKLPLLTLSRKLRAKYTNLIVIHRARTIFMNVLTRDAFHMMLDVMETVIVVRLRMKVVVSIFYYSETDVFSLFIEISWCNEKKKFVEWYSLLDSLIIWSKKIQYY